MLRSNKIWLCAGGVQGGLLRSGLSALATQSLAGCVNLAALYSSWIAASALPVNTLPPTGCVSDTGADVGPFTPEPAVNLKPHDAFL